MTFERITIDSVALPPEAMHVIGDENLNNTSNTEKRTSMTPVPSDLECYLNSEQLMALRTMEYFGWRLAFVRRAGLDEPITVIMSMDTLNYATIEKDGLVNEEPAIQIRH